MALGGLPILARYVRRARYYGGGPSGRSPVAQRLFFLDTFLDKGIDRRMDPVVLLLAFAAGFAFRQMNMPPLLGFLLAGFVGHSLGLGSFDSLAPLADAGILLLLFTIGLKLQLSDLKPRYVWGAALAHIVIVLPLTAAVLYGIAALYEPLSFKHPLSPWTLAFALSFSSTVLAIKLFEDRGEAASFYARIAIGILVVQDVLAVIYLVAMAGYWPSPWALGLLALPLCIVPLRHLFRAIGHGELLLLSGVVLAFGAAALFTAVGLKGGLGALVIGTLVGMADRGKAKELYDQLVGLKNLLLVGFFVQIGYYGLPSVPMLLVAGAIAALTLLRPLVYFTLLTAFGLRARTGWLTGLALFNYSEFGLIVAAIAVQNGVLSTDWITTLALALALSFLLAIPVNRLAHELFLRLEGRLVRQEKGQRLPEETVGSLGRADAVILGMGRIGRGAYDTLVASHPDIMGVDENGATVVRCREQGYHCIHGDGLDRDFWERTGLARRRLILISLTVHRENLRVARLARELGFTGTLAVAVRFPDERAALEQLGCVAYYLYEDVGGDFARVAEQALEADAAAAAHPLADGGVAAAR